MEQVRSRFIGSNAGYYLKYYKKLKESGKRVSWNWCSFFLSPMWFFARKMYLLGTIITAIFTMFSVGVSILYSYQNNSRAMAMLFPWSICIIAFSIALGMFGNYLYITHMETKIVFPGQSGLSKEEAEKMNTLRGGISFQGILFGYLMLSLMSQIIVAILTI